MPLSLLFCGSTLPLLQYDKLRRLVGLQPLTGPGLRHAKSASQRNAIIITSTGEGHPSGIFFYNAHCFLLQFKSVFS